IEDQRRLAKRTALADLDRGRALNHAVRGEGRSLAYHDSAVAADLAHEAAAEVHAGPHDQSPRVCYLQLEAGADPARIVKLDVRVKVRGSDQDDAGLGHEARPKVIPDVPGHLAPFVGQGHRANATAAAGAILVVRATVCALH